MPQVTGPATVTSLPGPLKVYVPYVEGGLAEGVLEALRGTGYEVVGVVLNDDDEAYWRFLFRQWKHGESFCVVEQDIVVDPAAFKAMVECPQPWCAVPYPYLRGLLYSGLGCMKYNAAMMQAWPEAVELAGDVDHPNHGPRHWCPTADTRVLRTDDLRWVPVGDVSVGDVLMGVDEHVSHSDLRPFRKYVRSSVRAAEPTMADVVRLVLSDGSEMRVTPDHRLLVVRQQKYRASPVRWKRVDELVPGADVLCRYLNPAEQDRSWAAGYLAGLFDGEGTTYGSGRGLSFGQRPGHVLGQGIGLIEALGFQTSISDNGHGVKVVHVRGGFRETLRFMTTIRPERLLAKMATTPDWGLAATGERVGIDAIEPAGRSEVMQVQTSSGTYISEGFASHNCTLDAALNYSVLPRRGFRVHVHTDVRPCRHIGNENGPTHGCLPRAAWA